MTDADLPFVAALYASTRMEELAATGWPDAARDALLDQQHRAQHHHYRLWHPDAEWLIVEREGVPIGRLYVSETGPEILLIDISLLPESRGAGIGGAIMADLLDHARALAKPVVLHVGPFNPARRLYSRLGFAPAGTQGASERMEWRPEAAD